MVMGFADSHRRSRVCGLYEDRVPQLFSRLIRYGRVVAGSIRCQPFCLLDIVEIRDQICKCFIHRHRRGQVPAANIGDLRKLQQPLHRAVLAVFSMQHGENHIDLARCCAVFSENQKAAVGRIG